MEKKQRTKRNRNAIRSMNMIMEAYVNLLMELPLEKISVTAIVAKAGLNRSTFYAHFSCPDEVYQKLEEKLVEEILDRLNNLDMKGLIDNPKPLLETLSQLIEERHNYVKLMFEKHPASHWMESIREAVIEKFAEDSKDADLFNDNQNLMINLRFFVGGYIALCRDYISNKIEMPIAEMTDVLATTISGGLASIKK